MRTISLFIIVFFGLIIQSFSQVVPQSNSSNALEMNVIPQEKEEVPTEIEEHSNRSEPAKKLESPSARTKSTVNSDQTAFSSAQQKQQLTFQLQSSLSRIRNSTTSRSPEIAEQQRIIRLVNQLEKTDNQSFEYHYFKYISGNYDFSLLPHLHKAQQLQPNNLDVLIHLGAYYWITKAHEKALQVTDQLFTYGRLDASLKQYAQDVLLSVPKNGTLITHGVEDTYSILYVQHKEGLRGDVKVLSLDWLQNLQFREFANSQYFELPNAQHIDVNYLILFCQLNPTKQLALSFTLPSPYLQAIKSNLYVHGLVAIYSTNPLDINCVEENNVLFNQLNKRVLKSPQSDRAVQLAVNYLPMLLTLKKSTGNARIPIEQIDEWIEQLTSPSKLELRN